MIQAMVMLKRTAYSRVIVYSALIFVISFVAIPNHIGRASSFDQWHDSILTPQPTPGRILNADTAQIQIRGSGSFIAHTRAALNLLGKCDPDAFLKVDTYLDRIQEYNRSGMEINSSTFLASNTTAFAPGYSREAQLFWYLGTIVHDAHHNWQNAQGYNTNWGSLSLEEREALEAEARAVQIETLTRCRKYLKSDAQREADVMLNYLISMQANPQNCTYCQVEWDNRNW